MNYADIKTIDIQDGEGVRVSIYVSGCHFHCKGCHNQVAWDFNYGKKFDDSTIDYIVDQMNHDYIAGLSILGGEPLELVNQQCLVDLVKKVKDKYPEKTIWCYTGYTFEQIQDLPYLKYVDVLVDGPFIPALRELKLKWKGSSNQRVILVKETLKTGKIVVRDDNDEPKVLNEWKSCSCGQ